MKTLYQAIVNSGRMELWKQVIVGLIAGVICGILFPNASLYMRPIGTIFLRCIMMLAPIMIFTSLVSGIISVGNDQVAKLGLKSLFSFAVASIFAVMFGMLVAILLEPGAGCACIAPDLPSGLGKVSGNSFDFISFIINIVPDNIFRAFASDSFIQIVFLALFFGLTINSMQGEIKFKSLTNELLEIILKMISKVLYIAPYATFALTSWSVAFQGLAVLATLSKLVLSIMLAMILQYLIFGLAIRVFAKISPMPFYRKSIEYQTIAFSTSSSKVALPVTIKTCENAMGMSHAACNFVLPLGASINMCGFAINLTMVTIFFAQSMNIILSWQDYLVIMLTATFGSIGGAGIPSASLMMLPMVMSAVNLPLEGIAVLAGVDRLLDMLRTTINITGDATITLILDAKSGKLDIKKYYS